MAQVASGGSPISQVGEFKLIEGISRLLGSSRVRSSSSQRGSCGRLPMLSLAGRCSSGPSCARRR